ncbi:hypothetical protein BH09BAC3_BH09BAC3_18670 [soil metagenome]
MAIISQGDVGLSQSDYKFFLNRTDYYFPPTNTYQLPLADLTLSVM